MDDARLLVMGALTEIEIFDCLAENLRLAAGHCEDLAVQPRKGATYNLFRHELRLVEGACRQASAWRQDTRWLPVGLMVEEAHKRAGDWLRGVKDPVTGRRAPIAEGQRHPLFVKLAQNLHAFLKIVDTLRHGATGRTGMILPRPLPTETRTHGRPIQVLLPPRLIAPSRGLLL